MMPRLIIIEAIILGGQLLLYFGCEIFQHDYINVKRKADDRIPFVPGAAYVYISWFPLVALFPVSLYFISAHDYIVYQLSIIISNIISTAIYLAIPTRFTRPEVILKRGDAASGLMRLVYLCDFRGSNCTPSLHCIQCFIIALTSMLCPGITGAEEGFILCLCLAIVVSTLLTKQHVLMDVVTAVPAAVFSYAAGWLLTEYIGQQTILAVTGLC